jgi:hypothetical protein
VKASAGASSESLLEELEVEVAEKVNQMRMLCERLALRLESDFKMEMLKLPKQVRTMTMREFIGQYGGDVDEAMKQQAKRDCNIDHLMAAPPPARAMPPPPQPAARGGKKGKPGSSVGAGMGPPAPVPQSGRGSKRTATSDASIETPGVRGRSTRSRLAPDATPGGQAAKAAAAGLATPAGGIGSSAGMFTPRMGETPRVAQRGEVSYSANGSPINLLDTVKARAGKRGRTGPEPAPSINIVMVDGTEKDLGEALKDFEAGDDASKEAAVSQLEALQAQVEAHLKALRNPNVPEI